MTLKTRIAKLELVTTPPEEVIETGPLMGMTASGVAAMMKRIDGKTRGLPGKRYNGGGDDGDGGQPMPLQAASA